MSIQLNQYLVKEGVAVVNLQAEKVTTDNDSAAKGVGSKPQVVTAVIPEANTNERVDSFLAHGFYGFLAMKP